VPIEAVMLLGKSEPVSKCPKCGAKPFRSFLRGQIQRFRWFGLRKKYCAVTCADCKEIVGYEDGNGHV
jgi:formate dehydrogenase maturation protein FdhE